MQVGENFSHWLGSLPLEGKVAFAEQMTDEVFQKDNAVADGETAGASPRPTTSHRGGIERNLPLEGGGTAQP